MTNGSNDNGNDGGDDDGEVPKWWYHQSCTSFSCVRDTECTFDSDCFGSQVDPTTTLCCLFVLDKPAPLKFSVFSKVFANISTNTETAMLSSLSVGLFHYLSLCWFFCSSVWLVVCSSVCFSLFPSLNSPMELPVAKTLTVLIRSARLGNAGFNKRRCQLVIKILQLYTFSKIFDQIKSTKTISPSQIFAWFSKCYALSYIGKVQSVVSGLSITIAVR